MGAQADSAQAVRELTVRFGNGKTHAVSADVRVPGLAAVSSIELSSVTFGAGTAWKPAPGQTCAVKPDSLMLVTNP